MLNTVLNPFHTLPKGRWKNRRSCGLVVFTESWKIDRIDFNRNGKPLRLYCLLFSRLVLILLCWKKVETILKYEMECFTWKTHEIQKMYLTQIKGKFALRS